ncbi:hypothetical protein BH11ARM1_BH11ARM1_06110 [soil metagenome]
MFLFCALPAICIPNIVSPQSGDVVGQTYKSSGWQWSPKTLSTSEFHRRIRFKLATPAVVAKTYKLSLCQLIWLPANVSFRILMPAQQAARIVYTNQKSGQSVSIIAVTALKTRTQENVNFPYLNQCFGIPRPDDQTMPIYGWTSTADMLIYNPKFTLAECYKFMAAYKKAGH